MKKYIAVSSLAVAAVLILVRSSLVYAQDVRLNPDDITFDIVPKIICAIFPNCQEGQTDPNATPTPIPPLDPSGNPLPSGAPLPTTDPNPPITPPPGVCMPPGGPITCGTRNVPIPSIGPRACGHCGLGYPRTGYCYVPPALRVPLKDTNGNAEAIDIGHGQLDSIPLPFIKGRSINWYHDIEDRYKDNDPSWWQEYNGTDTDGDKKTYKIRYLHTQRGSGVPVGQIAASGREGAKVALQWLKADGTIKKGNHIHIQIYDTRANKWVDATDYYCRN